MSRPLLCIGHACYDLIFLVDEHPAPDQKIVAGSFSDCGGGTAANGAVAAARLGHRVLLAAYLGNDAFGKAHVAELEDVGVDTTYLLRGDGPTAISSIFVKPDGRRSIVNYRQGVVEMGVDGVDLAQIRPGALLLDGHQIGLARALVEQAHELGVPTILDGDGLHPGAIELADRVDYLVTSEHFARGVSGEDDLGQALESLNRPGRSLVITMGEHGLLWAHEGAQGQLPAYAVKTVDSTGAGDAFHGAFAAGVAAGYDWAYLLAYASATGALCTTVVGARPGMPTRAAVEKLIGKNVSI